MEQLYGKQDYCRYYLINWRNLQLLMAGSVVILWMFVCVCVNIVHRMQNV